MSDNLRRFVAGPDPFGRNWQVEFKWHQTGVSIRHADTVDVKYNVWTDDEAMQEKILALPLPLLLDVSKEANHPITDGWCMRLAAQHLREMVRSFEDWDKTLITLSLDDLRRAAGVLQPA